jgi:D-proline reductase (dithiol) PrdB
MPSLDRLPEANRKSLLETPVEVHATTPFARPAKPLSQSVVAIVTTAGLHLHGDKPFVPGDPSYRLIPSDTQGDDLLQTHNSIGFDRTGVMADVNVVFPIDRLREMVAEGCIGSLAPTFYSFMGAQRDPSLIRTNTAPEVAELLLKDGVEVVLLTPT